MKTEPVKKLTLIYGISPEMLSPEKTKQLQIKHELIFAPTLDDAFIAVANAAKAGKSFQKVISLKNAEKITELSLCVKHYFANAKFEKFFPDEVIASHFVLDEYWNELPQYAGYVPLNGRAWQSIKDDFHVLNKFSSEKPLFLNLVKDEKTIGVFVYGFKIPYCPPVTFLGTDAAIRGRVTLCKVLTTKEFIAIAW